MMQFIPDPISTAAERKAFLSVRTGILLGTGLKPGDAFREAYLTGGEIQLGRGPARKVLIAFDREGLREIDETLGPIVPKVTDSDARRLYLHRFMFEVESTTQLILKLRAKSENARKRVIATLYEIIDRMEQCKEHAKRDAAATINLIENDICFHAATATEGGCKPRDLEYLRYIHHQLILFYPSIQNTKRHQSIIDEHKDVVARIEEAANCKDSELKASLIKVAGAYERHLINPPREYFKDREEFFDGLKSFIQIMMEGVLNPTSGH